MPRVAFAIAVCQVVLYAAAARAGVEADRVSLYAAYAAQLDELAAWCAENDLTAESQLLAAWLPERSADQLTLFVPPSVAHPSGDAVAAKSEADVPEWRKRWLALRKRQAESLAALAGRALDEGRAAVACELMVEALREDPHHELARRALGYVRFRGTWHTSFEVRQLRSGKVWHERFGWLPQADVARYERGERFALGRWMSADEEAALRADMARGWRIESDHYLITTNHSLEAGVELARRLEALAAVWQQVFPTYLATSAELARRLEGRATPQAPRQHEVIYYRTRDEYKAALGGKQANIDITLGIYFDDVRRACFFAGEEQDSGTLYHEAVHQLFQEARRAAPRVGREANFWIVEGIACYFESLAEHEGWYTLGGDNAGRMPAARHRLLTDGFYMPLGELVRLGLRELQTDPLIAMLYSQSAGLADFFMHAEGGRYRDALARYLAAVYTGRATPATLAEATGARYEALDREYRAFLSAGALPPQAVRPAAAH